MGFVVPQIKLTWQVCWFFLGCLPAFSAALARVAFPSQLLIFLYWLESLHCFLNRKSPCIPTNNKFPLGVLIILNTQFLAGAELREAKTDVPGLEKKKNERMESWPPKSIEISIRKVWIGRLYCYEMLQGTCSYIQAIILSSHRWIHNFSMRKCNYPGVLFNVQSNRPF